MTPEEMTILLAITENVLTRLGIPAVFLVAWWRERAAHDQTQKRYERDLRRCAGMSLPEDMLSSPTNE